LRESLPSENAPAPENPVVIRQNGLQLTHSLVMLLGQLRFSTGSPFPHNDAFFTALLEQFQCGEYAGWTGPDDNDVAPHA
jgi:hypothetical protein